MKKNILAVSVVSAFLLSACGPAPQQTVVYPTGAVVQQPGYVQPQTVVVQQPNNTGELAGATALGYMMGSAGNRGSSYDTIHHTTVVNKTVIVNNHAAPVVAPSAQAQAPRPPVVAQVQSQSMRPQTTFASPRPSVPMAPASAPSFSRPSSSFASSSSRPSFSSRR